MDPDPRGKIMRSGSVGCHDRDSDPHGKIFESELHHWVLPSLFASCFIIVSLLLRDFFSDIMNDTGKSYNSVMTNILNN